MNLKFKPKYFLYLLSLTYIFIFNFSLAEVLDVNKSNVTYDATLLDKSHSTNSDEAKKFKALTPEQQKECSGVIENVYAKNKSEQQKNVIYSQCVDRYTQQNAQKNTQSNNSTQSADASGVGDIRSLCSARQRFAIYTSSYPLISSFYNKITSSVCELESLISECQTTASSTEAQCLEEKDPGIMQSVSEITGPLSDIGGTIGMADQCAKYAGALKGMNAAVGAFRTNCGRVKANCERSCGEAIASARAIVRQSKSVYDQLYSMNGKNETHKENLRNIEYKTQEIISGEVIDSKEQGSAGFSMKSCQGKEQVLQKAGQNAIKLGASQTAAANCNKQLSSKNADFCKTYPHICDSKDVTSTTDCTKAENATNVICICVNNPTDPQCIGTRSTQVSNGNGTSDVSGGFIDGKLPNSDLGSLNLSSLDSGGFIDGKLNGGDGSEFDDFKNGGGAGGNGGLFNKNNGGSRADPSDSRTNPKGSGPKNLSDVGNVGSGNNNNNRGSRGQPGNLDEFSIGDGSGNGGNPSENVGSLGNVINGENNSNGAGEGLDLLGFGKDKSDKDKNSEDEKELNEIMDPKSMAALLAKDGVTKGLGMSLFEKVSRSYKNNRATLLPE